MLKIGKYRIPLSKPFVEMRRAPHFVVESEAKLDVFADGEPLTTTPVRFAIASEKLKLVV